MIGYDWDMHLLLLVIRQLESREIDSPFDAFIRRNFGSFPLSFDHGVKTEKSRIPFLDGCKCDWDQERWTRAGGFFVSGLGYLAGLEWRNEGL